MTTTLKWMIILGAILFVLGMIGSAVSMMFSSSETGMSPLVNPFQMTEAEGDLIWIVVINNLVAATGMIMLLGGISKWLSNRRKRSAAAEPTPSPQSP